MSRSTSQFVFATGLFALVIGGYFWWYHVVSGASTNADTLATAIAVRTRTAARVAATSAELDTLSAQESAVSAYFVPLGDVVPFIETLQTLGASVGAEVNILSVAAGSSKTSPTLTIMLSIAGTFDQVVRAVGAIEYAPYDLTVSALTISGSNKDWHASMTIVVSATGTATTAPLGLPGTQASSTAPIAPPTSSGTSSQTILMP